MQVIVNISVRDSHERAHPIADIRIREASVKSAGEIIGEIIEELPEHEEDLDQAINQHLTIGAFGVPTDPD